VLDSWALEQHRQFVAGEITSEQMRENGLLRYKKGHAEMRERERRIDFIIASDSLEGFTHDEQTLDQIRRSVAGEVTTDELLEDVRNQLKCYEDSLR